MLFSLQKDWCTPCILFLLAFFFDLMEKQRWFFKRRNAPWSQSQMEPFMPPTFRHACDLLPLFKRELSWVEPWSTNLYNPNHPGNYIAQFLRHVQPNVQNYFFYINLEVLCNMNGLPALCPPSFAGRTISWHTRTSFSRDRSGPIVRRKGLPFVARDRTAIAVQLIKLVCGLLGLLAVPEIIKNFLYPAASPVQNLHRRLEQAGRKILPPSSCSSWNHTSNSPDIDVLDRLLLMAPTWMVQRAGV